MTLHHETLVTLARDAHAAAGDADVARLRMDLDLFVHMLHAHVYREYPLLTHLPPAEARLLQRGQARVSAAARALLADTATGCAGDLDRCITRSEKVQNLMFLQAGDERQAFHRSSLAGAPRLLSEVVA